MDSREFVVISNNHNVRPTERRRRLIMGCVKAEKIQDIENHTKTTVSNQENDSFNPILLYITARNSIHVQDVVNTCVKMEIYMQE